KFLDLIQQKFKKGKIWILLAEELKNIIKRKKEISLYKGNDKKIKAIISPYSKFRIFWDFLIGICVVYNVITLPLLFFQWTTEVSLTAQYTEIIDLIIDGFCYFDVILNFRTGYIDSFNNIVAN